MFAQSSARSVVTFVAFECFRLRALGEYTRTTACTRRSGHKRSPCLRGTPTLINQNESGVLGGCSNPQLEYETAILPGGNESCRSRAGRGVVMCIQGGMNVESTSKNRIVKPNVWDFASGTGGRSGRSSTFTSESDTIKRPRCLARRRWDDRRDHRGLGSRVWGRDIQPHSTQVMDGRIREVRHR